jgi:hypothetical protein
MFLQGVQPHHSRQPEACAGCRLWSLPGSLPAGVVCRICTCIAQDVQRMGRCGHRRRVGAVLEFLPAARVRSPSCGASPSIGPNKLCPKVTPCHPLLRLLQDAHELFCGLLDLLQSEVLAREARRLSRTCIRISETADPAARNFSFAVGFPAAIRTRWCVLCGRAGYSGGGVAVHPATSPQVALALPARLPACPLPDAGATRAGVQGVRCRKQGGRRIHAPLIGTARSSGKTAALACHRCAAAC